MRGLQVVTDFAAILDDDSINCVVELMGGVTDAKDVSDILMSWVGSSEAWTQTLSEFGSSHCPVVAVVVVSAAVVLSERAARRFCLGSALIVAKKEGNLLSGRRQ